MNYCGIDLAGVSSYAYVTDEKGRKLWAGPVATAKRRFGVSGEEAPPRRIGNRHRGGQSNRLGVRRTGEAGSAGNRGQSGESQADRREPAEDGQDRRQDLVRAVAARWLAASGAHAGSGSPRAAWAAGGSAAIGLARSKLCNVVRGMLRQTGVRLPARACPRQTGWKRLFAAGFEHDHMMHIVAALLRQLPGVDQVDPRA